MIKEQIGLRIKEIRRTRNLTQEQLALASGLDRTYIASVEMGKRNISIVNLEKIARALNVSLSDLFKDL